MDLAIVLVVSGLVIGFGAFVFAAVNMLRGFTAEGSFSGFFRKHIGAMIAMALGMVIFVLGVVIAVAEIVSRAF